MTNISWGAFCIGAWVWVAVWIFFDGPLVGATVVAFAATFLWLGVIIGERRCRTKGGA